MRQAVRGLAAFMLYCYSEINILRRSPIHEHHLYRYSCLLPLAMKLLTCRALQL